MTADDRGPWPTLDEGDTAVTMPHDATRFEPGAGLGVFGPEGEGRRVRRPAQPDWPSIERDYRAGDRSLRQMGVLHGCSHSSIANKARRDGWTRDGGSGRTGPAGTEAQETQPVTAA